MTKVKALRRPSYISGERKSKTDDGYEVNTVKGKYKDGSRRDVTLIVTPDKKDTVYVSHSYKKYKDETTTKRINDKYQDTSKEDYYSYVNNKTDRWSNLDNFVNTPFHKNSGSIASLQRSMRPNFEINEGEQKKLRALRKKKK